MPDEPLVGFDKRFRVPLTHQRVVICQVRRAAPEGRRGAAVLLRFPQQLVSQPTQRLRLKRDVGDIFEREFPLRLPSPPAAGARNRSIQDRPQFSLGPATSRRTLWLALRAWPA